MALKSLLFVSILLAAMEATPPTAEAQMGLISGLLDLIQIQGTVFCTPNGNMDAMVQLQRGGNTVSSAGTNGSGVLSMMFDPLQFVLSSLLNNCSLVVNTPLAKCNGELPSAGSLISSLQFIGNTFLGMMNVANIVPAGFHFIPSN